MSIDFKGEAKKRKRARLPQPLIELPHAGHFICGDMCSFKRATVVNERFIVSTIGEYRPSVVVEGKLVRPQNDNDPPRALGANPRHLYETMVFKAKRAGLTS